MTELWQKLWRHPAHMIWVLCAYIPFLGKMSVPLTGDQKVYLSIALEMQERGSWLKPILFGEGNYVKPPFQYWMTLLGWKIFGISFWGALLPSVLAVVLTAWLLGEIATLLHDRRGFVNAGLWFAASLGTATFGATAQMEIDLCLFYAASWWAALKYLSYSYEQRPAQYLYLAFLIAGAASLVKSPLYSVFWVLSFVSYLLVAGEWELFRVRQLYKAWFLGMVVGASWYVWIAWVDGTAFWNQYILYETWEKKAGNGSSWWSLWVALLYFCFPFTLMLVPSLRAIAKGRRSWQVIRFVLCWAWPPALFFTLYPYRVKSYLYILVPLAALLIDWGYYSVGRTRAFAWMVRLSSFALAIVLGALSLVLWRAEMITSGLAFGLVAIGLWSMVCGFKEWVRGFALASLAAVLLFRLAAVQLGEQDIEGLRMARALAPESRVAMWDDSKNVWHEVGYLSCALGERVLRAFSLDELAKELKAGNQVILSDEQYGAHAKELQAKLLGMGVSRDWTETSWMRWKVRTRFPYRELIFEGRDGVTDFEEKLQREFRILQLAQ